MALNQTGTKSLLWHNNCHKETVEKQVTKILNFISNFYTVVLRNCNNFYSFNEKLFSISVVILLTGISAFK
jgi:hypothetical protein